MKGMGEPKIDGKTATIWVDLEGLFGSVKTVPVPLVKEGGNWKIGGF